MCPKIMQWVLRKIILLLNASVEREGGREGGRRERRACGNEKQRRHSLLVI